MHNLLRWIGILLLSLWISSCQSDRTTSHQQMKEDYRQSLPAYNWLNDSKNYKASKEQYLDTFNLYFNRALQAQDYNTAADYLIAYGNSRRSVFDKDYFSLLENFYSQYKSALTDENKTYIAYFLGTQSYSQGDLQKSTNWLEESVSYAPENNNHKQIIGFALFAIAQNYHNLTRYDSSEKFLIDAQKIFVEVGDIKNQGTVNLLLYDIYMQSSLYEQAEQTLRKGLDIAISQKSDYLIFSAYGMYIHLRVAQTDTIGAIEYIDTLNNFSQTYDNISVYHLSLLYQYLAFKYIALGQEDSAKHYLEQAHIYTDSAGVPDLKMRTYFQEVYYINKFNKPITDPYLIESYFYELAKDEVPNRMYMNQLASALLRYYEGKGQYDKALYFAKFRAENASQISEERAKGQLFEAEKKFQSELKEQIIQNQEYELNRRSLLVLILIIGILLLALIFISYFIWNKNKAIIQERKLTEQFTALLLQKSEEERRRIASDLHDSVSNELVSLRHAFDGQHSALKDKIDAILEEVRSISRNLTPAMFDRVGLTLSIEQMIERVQNNHDFFIATHLNYKGGLTSDKELQLYRIIQEAITNIIKHAHAHAGKISIDETDKEIIVNIEDNGQGFDIEDIRQKGQSFGLLNIQERAKYINGKVQIDSSSQGTKINITITKE